MKMVHADIMSARRLEPTPLGDVVTEDSAAVEFVTLHGENLRFCHDTGDWYLWNGNIWENDRRGVAYQWVRELSRHLSDELCERLRPKIAKTTFVSGVEKFAKVDPVVAVNIEFWDRDPLLLGTPDGTVDLKTGVLRRGFRDDGITKSTLVAPNSADCPRWLQFLAETAGGDNDLIRFLQQWCGYALTGLTREHALVFVYGPGGNGKSVFLNIVTAILGQYACVAAMDTFTASKNEKHPTDMAMLRGARMVTASETEEGRSWAECRIKQMTGGDPISARFMRQDFFTFKPQFKLTIVGNHKPVLRNVDEAARRRFLIVPFERKPGSPDRELEAKLLLEAPAILQWMIRGCLDWQANGLTKPASVLAATEEYFSDQNLFVHWLEDDCESDVGNSEFSETSSILFKSWKDYALSAGNSPGTQQSFKDQMTRHGFRYYRGRIAREFFGVRLKPRGIHHED